MLLRGGRATDLLPALDESPFLSITIDAGASTIM